jgi:hypothetical protein
MRVHPFVFMTFDFMRSDPVIARRTWPDEDNVGLSRGTRTVGIDRRRDRLERSGMGRALRGPAAKIGA